MAEHRGKRLKVGEATQGDLPGLAFLKQGAEARVYKTTFMGRACIVKERFPKKYRHPQLDAKLTKQRLNQETRQINKCKLVGIPTPNIYHVDVPAGRIYLEFLEGTTLREFIIAKGVAASECMAIMKEIGVMLATIHSKDMVHGDLTTSNLMVREGTSQVVLIDFGLSVNTRNPEDKAVDLYVLERAFASTHPRSEPLFAAIMESYAASGRDQPQAQAVLKKLEEVRARGRKRTMLG